MSLWVTFLLFAELSLHVRVIGQGFGGKVVGHKTKSDAW